MKRRILISVTLALLAGLAASCASGTEDAGDSCSLSTLAGRYDYEMHGVRRIGQEVVQYVEVGKESYDGKGNLTNAYTDTHSKELTEISGTYTLGKNCQGAAHYSNGDTFQMWVSPDGSQFSFLIDDAEGREPALSGSEERTDADPDATCSTESLKGTYRYSARGVRQGNVPYIEVGFETFDGTGKLTDVYANSNTPEINNVTASYTLGEDCVARIDYGDGDVYTGFVAPDGSRFYWIQTGGAGAGEFFGGYDQRITTSTETGLT